MPKSHEETRPFPSSNPEELEVPRRGSHPKQLVGDVKNGDSWISDLKFHMLEVSLRTDKADFHNDNLNLPMISGCVLGT